MKPAPVGTGSARSADPPPPPPFAPRTPSEPPAPRMRAGLAASTAYNLLGQGAPLVVAYFAIPVLTRELGDARFGLLTLAWAVLGYFSVFDLGLGRALTQAVADRLDGPRAHEIPPLVWTALVLMLGLGVAGAVVASAVAPWLAGHVLNVPAALRGEAVAAFMVIALSIPVVIVSAAIRGVLEAVGRFDLVNAVRVPQGILSFAGPVLVLPLSRSLAVLSAVLLAGRLVATVAWYVLMLRVLPALRTHRRAAPQAALPLLRFASWMTISNIVSPLMVTLDRFVIGAAMSVAAVAYYTAPWEAVTKLWIIPGALGAVLFPAFATARASDPARARALFGRGVKATAFVLVPIVVLAIGFAGEALDAWLGDAYASRSTTVLRWLAAGVFVNSVAQIPFALVQGSGRPDVTAKLHLAELPIYVLTLWALVAEWGIVGAAAAWTLRASLDAAALFAYAHRLCATNVARAARGAGVVAWGAAVAAMLAWSGYPLASKCALAAALLASWVAVAWVVGLSPRERAALRRAAAGGRRRLGLAEL